MQHPIPIWMGGSAEVVLKRIGEIADGWFPQMKPGDEARRMIEQIRDCVNLPWAFQYCRNGPCTVFPVSEKRREPVCARVGCPCVGNTSSTVTLDP